ncbi:MAG: type II toxin-antitoxin system PrlF family antitoxin [Verrucomicrobia bacterium]|nr:type II toxin-antitoxin system PrlF family antitoxin [Verrucomicrobiota bacterium]
MDTSTLPKKGQTTVPLKIREALKVRPRQRLEWTVRDDGTAVVRPMQSALGLFGSLRPKKPFPGRESERARTLRAVAAHAANEGTA